MDPYGPYGTTTSSSSTTTTSTTTTPTTTIGICTDKPDGTMCGSENPEDDDYICMVCIGEECEAVDDSYEIPCGDQSGCSVCTGGSCQPDADKIYCGDAVPGYYPAHKCKICEEGACVNAPAGSECTLDNSEVCAWCDGEGECIIRDGLDCGIDPICGVCQGGECKNADDVWCGDPDTDAWKCQICVNTRCVPNDGVYCSPIGDDWECSICLNRQCVPNDGALCGYFDGCQVCSDRKCENLLPGSWCLSGGGSKCDVCDDQGFCFYIHECYEAHGSDDECWTCLRPPIPGEPPVCVHECLSCAICETPDEGGPKFCNGLSSCIAEGDYCSFCMQKESDSLEGYCEYYCLPHQNCDTDHITCL